MSNTQPSHTNNNNGVINNNITNAKSQNNNQRDVKPDVSSSYASQSQKKRLLAKAQSESLIGNNGMKQEPGIVEVLPLSHDPEHPKPINNHGNKAYHQR